MADQRETTGYMALLGDAPASSSGGGWLSGLPGGGGSPLDLYGDLFTPEQKKALQQRELSQGLFRMAEKLGQAAQPQRVPVNTLGALGSALGAFGTGSDITEQALKGMQTAEQVRALKQKRDLAAKVLPFFWKTAGGDILQSPSDTPPAPGAVPLGPAPTAPGAPTGGPLASNAPPPPPGGAPSQIGLPGPGLSPFGLPDTSQIGLPPPGTSPFGLPPGQQSGLLPPPPGANPQMGQGGGLLAGLPFDQTAPGAGGDDLSNIRVEQLSGEAAPAGADVPFPTTANPAKPKSAWAQGVTYDAPSRPYDPSVDRPANAAVGPEERGLLARAKAPDTVIPPPRDNRSTLLDEIARRESGNRNIMQQLVPTTQSTAQGPWQITNETWRDIAPKVGIDTEKYPNAMSVPVEVQRVVADRLLQERGTGPWKAMRVADTGAPGAVPGMPSAAAAAAVTAGGKIPGLNMTPQQLASFNAMFEMAGLGDPFKSLLDTYYKSPAYLMQAEGAKALGALPFEGPKAAAIAAAQQQYIQQNATHQSDLDIAKELLTKGGLVQMPDGSYKQITSIQEGLAAVDIAKEKAKSDLQLVDTTLTFPGETEPRTVQMTGAQARAVAEGRPVQVGGVTIPPMTGIKLGKPQVSEADKARIGIDAQLAKEVGDQALQARRLLPLVDEALVLARKTPEGLAGPASAKIAQIAAAFGVAPTPGQSNAETLGAINQRLIPLVREPGSQSNAEMDAYLAAGPGLALTADGRVKIAEMTKAIGQRAIAVAEVYRDTIGDPSSVRRAKLDALDKPLFTPEQRAAMQVASAPATTAPAVGAAGGAPPVPTATGPKGEKYILRNGQWVPQ